MFHISIKSVLQKAPHKDGSYQHASMLEVKERPKTLCALLASTGLGGDLGMQGYGRNIFRH